nr:hypothetical protein [Tanacetum cinerariifolium]
MNREWVGTVKENNMENDLADKDSDNDVEEVHNEAASFMASNSEGGAKRKSLYVRRKDDYDDNPYDDDECEDLKEVQLPFCNAFDIRLHGFAQNNLRTRCLHPRKDQDLLQKTLTTKKDFKDEMC